MFCPVASWRKDRKAPRSVAVLIANAFCLSGRRGRQPDRVSHLCHPHFESAHRTRIHNTEHDLLSNSGGAGNFNNYFPSRTRAVIAATPMRRPCWVSAENEIAAAG